MYATKISKFCFTQICEKPILNWNKYQSCKIKRAFDAHQSIKRLCNYLIFPALYIETKFCFCCYYRQILEMFGDIIVTL